MEQLIIKNDNGSENISSALLQRIYEMVLQITNGTLQLKGTVIVPHAKQSVLDYFKNNFSEFHITLIGQKYVEFADSIVAWHIAKAYDPDGIGVTQSDLNSINKLTASMRGTQVVSFNELSQFTNIVSIPNYAFDACTMLQSIGLSNITSIGSYAFRGCSSLTSVDLSNTTTIYQNSFQNCTSLTSVMLSPNLTKIDSSTFEGCTQLSTIDLSNITYIYGAAFKDCTNLTINNLDVSGKQIGTYAFYNCPKITGTLTIDQNTTIEHGDARYGYHFQKTGISQVILPSTLTFIWTGMFQECTSLSNIDLSNITKIRGSAFRGCTSLTHVDLSSVTEIGSDAFYNCTNLGVGETLEITHTGTSVPSSFLYHTKYVGLIMHITNITSWDVRYPAWEGANQLTYLDISDCTFTTVGSQYGNGNLVTYILPAGLTNCEYRVVEGLSNLQYFIILAETPPTVNYSDSFFSMYGQRNNARNANIYVKDSTVRDAYLADANWSQIPNASTRIKTLAELPVGVWKTGLYQQYEPYLSNSSDPAYQTS